MKGPSCLYQPQSVHHLLVLLLGLLLAPLAAAEPLRFALVAKSADSFFFTLVGRGCAEAARAEGDSCVLLGAPGPMHFRRQNEALGRAIDDGLDGLALSVSNSQFLAENALQRIGGIPLLTFDSDLDAGERHLRYGYVGADNLSIGRELGALAQRLRPQGGQLCILSATRRETNLQERIAGIRQQLGSAAAQPGRLQQDNGWREASRCPLYNADTPQNSLAQLDILLSTPGIDTVISTGSWLVSEPAVFRARFAGRLAELEKQGRHPDILIVTTGEPDREQQALLDEGLIQGYVSLDAVEMGRQSYRLMKRLARGLTIPERTYTANRTYLPGPPPPAREALARSCARTDCGR